MNKLITKYKNILYSSDNDKSDKIIEFNKYFEQDYSTIDTNKYSYKINNANKNIFFTGKIFF